MKFDAKASSEMKQILYHTPQGVFHIAKQYFTPEGYFTNSERIYFVEKSTNLVSRLMLFFGADDRS